MTNNNMTGLMQAFDFEQQAVRTLFRQGEPWFVAADVCRVLEIANHHHAIHGRPGRENEVGLDEDEKGVASVTTPRGVQQMLVINESGLYALIFKSRKPEAKKFRKWVTTEVLPTLRKTGAYVMAQEAARDEASARLERVREECVARVRVIDAMSAHAMEAGILLRQLSMDRVRGLHTLGRLRLDAVRCLWDLECGGQRGRLIDDETAVETAA
jgi:prophage antirepressor-like protein